MTDDFTAEDVAEMRRQGDFREFLRGQMRRPQERREFPEAAPPKERADGRPVGSWPVGTYPPGSPIPGRPVEPEPDDTE